MKKLSFKKGGCPIDGLAFDGKLDFPREPVLEVFSPKEIILPMLQNVGSPAEIIVSRGDDITVGQMVGKPTSALSVPVHSGVSGKVAEICSITLPDKTKCDAVRIVNDRKRRMHRVIVNRKKPEELAPKKLHRLLEFSGIVGMGGQGYPTAAKCRRAEIAGVQTLIVNACQSEPYLSADIHLLREQTDRVIRGACALAGLCRAKRIVFCVMDKWLIELKALEDAFRRHQTNYPDRSFHVRVLRSRFPQGYDRLLIKALFNVELEKKQLSEDTVGAVVFNASTCAAFSYTIDQNMPLVSRVISISGDTIVGHNISVPIGTMVDELLSRVPGAKSAHRCVYGGAMTGLALSDLHVPIIKTTQGISLIRHPDPPRTPCMHCGACIDACPVGLLPYLCYRLIETGHTEQLQKEGFSACISCGSCSFVCPAGLDLSSRISRAVQKEGSQR